MNRVKGVGKEYDVIVVGGGPAGLQAALTGGRMHRQVLLLDSGSYRNDPTDHLHNFVTHDGRTPAQFRAMARADLAAYETVEVRDVAVSAVRADTTGFVVTVGGSDIRTRRVVLATGVRDVLPQKPGLAGLFGTVAAHCPYCHGHEFSGEHVAILGNHAHVGRVAMLLERIASRLTVLTDGGELDSENAALLARTGVKVRSEPIESFSRTEGGASVRFSSGRDEHVGGLMVATKFVQSAAFAEQLGLRLLGSGCVEVDWMGRTSLPGVYAAGDLAHQASMPMPFSSVLAAAAAGQVAAAAVDVDLLALDHAIGVPS